MNRIKYENSCKILYFTDRVHEDSGNYSAFDDPLIDDELKQLLEGSPKQTASEISEVSPRHELKPVMEEDEGVADTQTR